MSEVSFRSEFEPIRDLKAEFRGAAVRFTIAAELAGVSIAAYETPDLPLFSALPPEQQEVITAQLNAQTELILEAKPEIGDYSYNRRMAWAQIRRHGLVLCSDVFEKLEDTDIIEIWDAKGHQLFRSFHGLKFFSYTLEEMFAYPFFELFERESAELEVEYGQVFSKLIRGETQTTIQVDIRPHLVREKRSRRRRTALMTPKIVSPLKNKQGQVVAFFHTCSAKAIEN